MSSPAIFPLTGKRVFVAGHNGMVGRAIVRRLESEDCEILTVDRKSLDLRDQEATLAWLGDRKPEAVFVAAARVGGILANDRYPADFLYDNLMIEANLIHGAFLAGVAKLLFLGSSCIYPRNASQPIPEEALLSGPLEPTNQWYAIAKIAGIKLCHAYRQQHGADFISAMPTNLYGPHDNFNLETSHVIPALIRKAHDAQRSTQQSGLVVWGSGSPRREFLHVDDCADAVVRLMMDYSAETHVNVGCGVDVTIRDLAEIIAGVVGYNGKIVWDASKPDGVPQKLMSIERLRRLGWAPRISLRTGLESTYAWYLKNAPKH